MAKISKLRRQAAKATRLAAGVSDQLTRYSLNAYAEEAEALADQVEALDVGLVVKQATDDHG